MTIVELEEFLELDSIGYTDIPITDGFIGKYVEYLSLRALRVPKESLLLDVLVKLSQVASLKRVNVMYQQEKVLCNIYAMLFMPSGSGKDYPLNLINKVNAIYFARFNERVAEHKALWDADIEAKADELFSTKSSKDQYKYIHRARTISAEISSATVEGFYSTRLEMSRADFGGTFVRIPEFADYVMSKNNVNAEFLTALIEAYEDGNTSPKAVKSESDQISVRGVPSNVLVYSSPFGLLGKSNGRLLEFFNRGGARRFFVCYPNIEREEVEDYSAMIDLKRESFAKAKSMEVVLKSGVSAILDRKDDNLALTDEAEYYYEHYFWYCDYLAISKYAGFDGIVSVVVSLPRKAMKLAGIIAVSEHPDRLEVDSDDMMKACKVAQFYFNHFVRFYKNSDEQDPIEVLGHYLISQNKPVTITDIRSERIVGMNKFSTWFEKAIQEVEDYLYSLGYVLVTTPYGKRKTGAKYKTVSKESLVQE